VIINPNNPTGAVYSKELLQEIVEIARQHNLIIFADEIYDKILYDEAQHHSIAALAPDLLTVTFNGLSKTYRVAGFRQGWMVLNGPKNTRRAISKAGDAGLDASVRQRAGPACYPDGAGRLPEYQRIHHSRRAPV
jgi:alanine-synthesizing transaminase